MLLERERELEALAAAVQEVRCGDGRLLVLEGPSGIGKTELLRAAREQARAAGMVVLTARGGEFEQDFPFGVVRQLLEPVLARADAAERERLLAGAARLGAAVLEQDGQSASPPTPPMRDPSFQALHGLHWLVANLVATTGPAALLVDDVQWADAASLRMLSFLARRIDEVPVLLALALRGADDVRVAELIRGPLARPLRPAPLTRRAVGVLTADRLGGEVEPPFAAAVHEVTGGNPSLVRELLVELEAQGAAPVAGQAERVRQIGPDAISAAVLRRLHSEPAAAAELAGAVAVLGEDTELAAAAELAGLEPAAARGAVDALVHAEVLEDRLPLSFVHPVVRAAIYGNLAPARRAALHSRAAMVLRARGARGSIVASHLLLAPAEGDPDVFELLLRAGCDALERGAPPAAATYLRRALREPPPDGRRGAVLLALGMAQARSGSAEAAETLQEAIAAAGSPEDAARAALECGRVLMVAGRAREGVELLERVAARLRQESPAAAGLLEAEQLMSGHAFRSVRERLLARVERLPADPATPPTISERVILGIAAIEEACAGDSAERAADHGRRALAGGALLMAVGPEAPPYYQPACALSLAGCAEEAIAAATDALESARALGSATGFAIASCARSWFNLHRGALDDAEADARQALTVDPETWLYVHPMAVGTLTEVLVETGRLEEAATVAAGGPVAGPAAMSVLFEILLGARGRLALATGRAREALDLFSEVGRRQREWGATTPSVFAWRSHAALAQLALGEPSVAAELAEAEALAARRFGAARMLGPALRVAGVCGGGVDRLREAVGVLAPSAARLEHARALVELGAALRRGNQRVEAREPLRLGLDLAHRCRALTLAERAREELRLAGARPRRAVLTGADSLTASERRIATMAVAGLSNRDIAQDLFLSMRTVEFHLSNAYRKLAITSRTELADALAATPAVTRA